MSDEIEAIIKEVSAAADWVEQYETKDDSNPLAEYIAELGYGDSSILQDFPASVEDQVTPEVYRELVRLKSLLPNLDGKGWSWEVGLFADVACHYMNTPPNTIEAAVIGEAQHELPEDLAARICRLSSEDFEEVARRANCHLDRRVTRHPYESTQAFIYMNFSYHVWGLTIDPVRLAERVREVEAETAHG